MPCILKVRIVSARNLPIMDRTTELTGVSLTNFLSCLIEDYQCLDQANGKAPNKPMAGRFA
jgi:hypothetical protein